MTHASHAEPTPSFPQASDLPLPVRVGVQASVVADVALRTAAATIVSTTTAPLALRPRELRRDFDRLAFYADLGAQGTVDAVFPAPTGPARVERVRRTRVPGLGRDAEAATVRFESDFVPVHPEMRVRYSRWERNRTAWAQHWRHADGPRPTIVVVHGFMASPHWVNSAFFSLPWFFGHGYDVLMVTLPFHGRRRTRPLTYSGSGLFVQGISQLNEAIGHAIHDLRLWVDHLFASGVPAVGMTGLSLGGYLTSLMASIDDRLAFAIPNVPVTDLADLLGSWFPASTLVQAGLLMSGHTRDEVQAAIDSHSPLKHQPVIAHDRRFVIAGLGDRLAPPDHARRLWEHWDRPEVHWFPGNHILHVDQGTYLKRMGRFLQRIEFAAPADATV